MFQLNPRFSPWSALTLAIDGVDEAKDEDVIMTKREDRVEKEDGE